MSRQLLRDAHVHGAHVRCTTSAKSSASACVCMSAVHRYGMCSWPTPHGVCSATLHAWRAQETSHWRPAWSKWSQAAQHRSAHDMDNAHIDHAMASAALQPCTQDINSALSGNIHRNPPRVPVIMSAHHCPIELLLQNHCRVSIDCNNCCCRCCCCCCRYLCASAPAHRCPRRAAWC
jgi:hypothetical protein